MNKYFKSDIKTLEELKKEYKKLVMQLHPDITKRDTTKEFQAMGAEYEQLFNRLKDFKMDKNGNIKKEVNKENVNIFKNIIDKIIFFEGITISIIGQWIWIEGNSYNYKEELKKLGFKWSKNKKAWYYADNLENCKRGRYSMQQLKDRFTTQIIENENILKLA